MKNVVFIGDSLTSGENNNFRSYAHIVKEKTNYNVSVLGVSGACFGDYSIYPVKDTLFTLVDTNTEVIRDADYLFIEFGINDTAAVIMRYVDINKVYISIVRAVDYIKQLNKNVKLTFLLVDATGEYSLKYLKYLKYDYFKDYPTLSDPILRYGCFENYLTLNDSIYYCDWDFTYKNIRQFISRSFDLILINEGVKSEYLDSDNIHPTEEGYAIIADSIIKHIKNDD